MNDHEQKPERNWDTALKAVLVGGLIIAMFLSGTALQRGLTSEDVSGIIAAYYEDTAEDKNDLCKDEANKDKPECAKKAPEEAEDIVGGEAPETVEVGPSTAQVTSAVRELLPALLAQSVAAYCANDRCKGDTPPKPKDGKDAPPPTDAQMLQAQTTFCAARNDCRGASGTDGTNGTNGKDAPKIVSIQCSGMQPATFIFTFDDGSTITEECEMLPPVEENP